MAREAARVEAGDLAVRDLDAVGEPLGELAEAGAEHQAEARADPVRAGADVLRGRAHAARCSGPKESGSSSARLVVRRTRSMSTRWIGASSGANSRRRWRQPPQGVHSSALGAATTTSAISPAAARDHRADRRRLGALALRIGGVLDVGAGEAAAVGRADRRADGEVGVRRVGAADRLAREREQLRVGRARLLGGAAQRVGVGALAQRVVADLERLAQLR